MFGTIFLKECRQLLKSIVCFVFVIVLIVFNASQFGDAAGEDIREAEAVFAEYNPRNPLMLPAENAPSYGERDAEIPEQVMPNAIGSLCREYIANQYSAYPFGFIRVVRLGEESQQRIGQIIRECTGLPAEEVERQLEAAYQKYVDEHGYLFINDLRFQETIPITVDYETFLARMEEADRLIGGGSSYAPDQMKDFGHVSITYEEKLADYQTFLTQDKITRAYARLFCDYAGINIALFAVFVPVALFLRDRRSGAQELLGCRSVSSVTFIGARFLAVTFMELLPVFLLSLFPLAQLAAFAARNHFTVDYLAFASYILAWILPTALLVNAVGFTLTLLTDTPLAILVQFFWSFSSIFSGGLRADSGFLPLVIRHNTVGERSVIMENFSRIAMNRVIYALLALALLAVSIALYEQKRRGRFHGLDALRARLPHVRGAASAGRAG